MALAGDFFRTRHMTEVAGVQTQIHFDWKLDSVDGADSINTVLADIATTYWDTVKAVLTTECVFSCMAFYNWSRPEQAIVYPMLARENVGSSHPQFQVVRVNRYAQTDAVLSDPIYRGAINLSGVAESLSTRGRINDLAEFIALESFCYQSFQTAVSGWTITPNLRHVTSAGPPVVAEFKKMRSALVNPTFLTLRGRKTSSCAA